MTDETKAAEAELLKAERAVLDVIGYDVSPVVTRLIEAAVHVGRLRILDEQLMDKLCKCPPGQWQIKPRPICNNHESECIPPDPGDPCVHCEHDKACHL